LERQPATRVALSARLPVQSSKSGTDTAQFALLNRFLRTLVVALVALTALAAAAAENLAARILILANRDDPDSLRIARHYAEARAVPPDNIIALALPLTETISWREFVATLWNPLLEQLVRDDWVDAIAMATTDPVGRRKYAPHSHRIAALVVCRGVPLKVAHDETLYAEVLPFTRRGEFRTNAGAVDAELSLLALPNYPINAFVPNPLFQNEHPGEIELRQVVKVSRLDGPTAADAMALVDHALEAERTGLLGRAYVDLSDRDPVGNAWLETAARQLTALNFDTDVDREPATLPATTRIDAPAIYFGWYAGELNGPFALPGFRFPPGAIALHIHSYSATTMRSATAGWTGPFVARGVTATVGNVNEPYLQFTHRPDLLLRALARGATWVDAGYFSLQALSWQEILIGDPLYRPFALPLDQQWRDLGSLPPRLAGYAALRRIRELDAAHQRDDATALARQAMRDVPNLAVGVELARRLEADGDRASAARALGFAALLKSFPTDEWALAAEGARMLTHLGDASKAVDLWHALLAQPTLTRELRLAWLPDARAAAVAAKNESQAAAWRAELDALTAPPAEKK
jgi:uncharacterized protein (TIGR03790 family)